MGAPAGRGRGTRLAGMKHAASPADARRAWIIAGSLLIAVAVLPLLGGSLGAYIPFLGEVLDLAWCSAMVLFAFGIRRAGSVVARDPLGIVALLVAGAAPVAFELLWRMAPVAEGPAEWMTIAANAELLIGGVALLLASVVIARGGAVPERVRWAPLVAVLVVISAHVLIQLVVMTEPQAGEQIELPAILVTNILVTGSLIVIGVLAIVSAPRAAPAADTPVQVYPPVA